MWNVRVWMKVIGMEMGVTVIYFLRFRFVDSITLFMVLSTLTYLWVQSYG